ncbi:MAG: ABC transporter ATP-binding protein [Patescibacteria group bacterium]|nr:ABC transporter ATP-binding protein [Patescibacteria group bacterium]
MAEEKHTFTWAEKRNALARQLGPFKSALVALGIAEIVVAAANGVTPYITGKFFDTLITPHTITIPIWGAYPAWELLLAAWALIQIIVNGVSIVVDRKSRRLTTKLEAGVSSRAYTHLLTLPISFHKKHRTGEITDNLSRAGWMLGSMVNTILSIAPQFLTIIVGVAISFAIYPMLAAVLLVGVAIYLLVLVRVLPETSRYQEEGFRVWNRAMGDAQDAYTNVSTVKQAGAEQYESKKILSTFYDKAVPLWYRMEQAWSNLNFSQRIIVAITQGAILLFSVFLISAGKITIGDLIAFNAYAGMIIGPFVALGNQWQTVQNGFTAVARTELVFGATPEAYEPPGAIALPDIRGDVTFENVSFSYESDQPQVLKDISFTAKAGEVIAFVGETGVGKSTAAELISGYYFPTSGQVRIDDHDMREVNLRDLRRRIAIVPQEVVLFNASIKENIRYGRPDASDAEIEEAAKKAHADVFIEKFPQRYEQEVGERGIKLSVGQKQRVAIARAILRNPRILILDEPTSALDSETERYVAKSFEELMRGRTTFIIAHRLSTVRKADKILVIKDGAIAEEGTHAELLTREDGIYHRLYDLHVGLYE